jgi:hypothetical protein
MSRKRYDSLIYFLLLAVLIGILQCIVRLMVGDQMFTLKPFNSWLLATNIISFINSVLLLLYYRIRQYRLAFYTGIPFIFSNLLYSIVLYLQLSSGSLAQYGWPIFQVLTVTGVIYAASLIFSDTGKQRWLRAAGIIMLINGLVSVFIIWSGYTKMLLNMNVSARITNVVYLISVLAPLFFLLHFRKERSTLKENEAALSPQSVKETAFRIAAIASSLVALPLGMALFAAAGSSLHWADHNFKKTKELAALFEAGIFIGSNGDILRYRLLKPLNYDTTRTYPLVISLPYGGQPGTDTIRQLEGAGAAQLLSTADNRKKYPAFLFVPNCPPGAGWGGIPNYPSIDALVYEAITSLDEKYKIDPKRRYVTGISRGGYGAWNFICTRPDLFAAAIPICGGGDPRQASNASQVAVWAFHGAKDKNVPVNGSRDMINAIKKAGGNPKYTEYPDEGHNIGYQVETTPGLWDWLFAQHKDNED